MAQITTSNNVNYNKNNYIILLLYSENQKL